MMDMHMLEYIIAITFWLWHKHIKRSFINYSSVKGFDIQIVRGAIKTFEFGNEILNITS